MTHELLEARLVVNWSLLIEQMRHKDLTLRNIQERTHIPESTIRSYRDGVTPKHHDGELLIETWMNVTQLARNQLPRTARPLSSANVS